MRTDKVYLTLGVVFSILSTFCACSGQAKTDDRSTALAQKVDSNEKLELDAQADVIFRDSRANVWFASREQGVYKYDGTDLALFTSDDGLGSYRILGVQEDDSGNVYFDTPEGIYKYDGEIFTTLAIAESGEAGHAWTSEPGDMWFRMGWDKSGPFRYDGKKLYHLKFPENEMADDYFRQYPNSSFNPYGIYSLYEDSKGNVWCGTSSFGIYMFDGQTVSWMYEDHLTTTPAGGSFGIRSIGEDRDGNYWICHPKYKYTLLPNETEGDGFVPLNYSRQIGIDNLAEDDLYFYSMELDANGNLFMFANEDGLWKNDGEKLTPFFIELGGENISPTSMYKDDEGIFWFSTESNGIYQYDGNHFERFQIE